MNNTALFGSAPLWLIFAATVAIILLSIYGGIVLSGIRRKKLDGEDLMPLNAIAGATLALLGFMLAFTFGAAASRYESRKQLLLDEVNSIGTTYLRAGFLPEPHVSDVRNLIRKYVDLRVEMVGHPEKIDEIIRQSETLQNEMWKNAEDVTRSQINNPEIVALFMESLNETIDLQTKRITVTFIYQIPNLMWFALLGLVILSMFVVGYLFIKSPKPNFILILAISLSFSLVILMVAALNKSDGTVVVNQKPMLELQKSLNK